MDMAVDVIHAITIITIALGTITEFQFRVGYIGAAADHTAMLIFGCGFFLLFLGCSAGSLVLVFALWQQIQYIFAKE